MSHSHFAQFAHFHCFARNSFQKIGFTIYKLLYFNIYMTHLCTFSLPLQSEKNFFCNFLCIINTKKQHLIHTKQMTYCSLCFLYRYNLNLQNADIQVLLLPVVFFRFQKRLCTVHIKYIDQGSHKKGCDYCPYADCNTTSESDCHTDHIWYDSDITEFSNPLFG